MVEIFAPLLFLAAIAFPFAAGAIWVVFSLASSPRVRLFGSSAVLGSYVTGLVPVPFGCCGRVGVIPLGYFVLDAPIESIAIVGPIFSVITIVIFATLGGAYLLYRMTTHIGNIDLNSVVRPDHVEDRIERRLNEGDIASQVPPPIDDRIHCRE